jgi:hypothetical protein
MLIARRTRRLLGRITHVSPPGARGMPAQPTDRRAGAAKQVGWMEWSTPDWMWTLLVGLSTAALTVAQRHAVKLENV